MSNFLAGLASLTLITCISSYIYFTAKGAARPNPATILVWLLIAIVNVVTYMAVVQGEVIKTGVAIVLAMGLTGLSFLALIKGSFSKPEKIDLLGFVLFFLVMAYWVISKNSKFTNVLLQIVMIVSFAPTIRGLIKGTGQERYLTWNLAIIAYFFQTAAIWIDASKGWEALAFPILNGIIGNGSVSFTIFFTNRRKKRQE